MDKIANHIKEENNHKNSIFSEFEILDWYDGAILGIGKLFGTNDFYFFQMVACDLQIDTRVFILAKTNLEWKNKFDISLFNAKPELKPSIIRDNVVQLFAKKNNRLYLLRTKDIDDKLYTLKEVDLNNLKYFDNIESVLNQSKKRIKEWFDFFIK